MNQLVKSGPLLFPLAFGPDAVQVECKFTPFYSHVGDAKYHQHMIEFRMTPDAGLSETGYLCLFVYVTLANAFDNPQSLAFALLEKEWTQRRMAGNRRTK